MTYNFVENTANDKIQSLQAIVDDDGSIKFTAPNLGSSNFDGFIPVNTASAYVNSVNAGDYFSPSGSSTFYQVISVEREDPSLTQTGSAYSGYQDIYYVDDNGELTSASFSSSAAVVYLKNEEWDSEERFLGNNGWIITSGGNAIFTNVAIRGRVEANEGFIGGTDQGWEITENLFSNASVGFYAPSATTGQVAIFAGAPFANRASAAFRVSYDGSVVASSANITGALTATTLNVGGSAGITYDGSVVTIGSSVVINSTLTTNSLQVGASPALLRIANDVDGTNDGIYIDPYNFWYSDGKFSVGGSANSACWNGSALSVKGNIIATSGSFSGDITAAAGRFTGSVTVSSGGKFIAGTVDNGVVLDDSGLTGFSNGSTMFRIPTTGSPTLAGFTIINSGLTGSGQNANIIVGNTGSAANSITIRGDKTGGQNAAIFTVQSGVATSSATGNGFYVDDAGRMRLAGSNGSLTFDGNNLSITGNVNATSGAFTGSVNAQTITASNGNIAGWKIENGALTASGVNGTIQISASTTGISVRNTMGGGVFLSASSPTYALWGGDSNASNAKFKVDYTGILEARTASFTDAIISASVFAQTITASNGNIAGFSISDTSLTRFVGGFYWTGITSGASAFFAGAQSASGTQARFWVSSTGSLFAADTTITGKLTAPETTISGNLTVGTNTLFVDSGNNRVGIGTFSPASALHVVGSITASTIHTNHNGGGTNFRVGDDVWIGDINCANVMSIRGVQNSAVGFISFGTDSASLGYNGTSLVYNGNVNFDSGTLYIDSANKVGFGTTSPASAFHVTGSALFDSNVLVSGNFSANNVNISGSITTASLTSTSGIIAGWTLSASAFTAGTGASTVGLVSAPQSDNIAIYAGNATPSSAPFRVTQTGSAFATTKTSGDSSTSLATTAFVSNMIRYNGATSPTTASVAGYFVIAVNPGTSLNGCIMIPQGATGRTLNALVDRGINGAASAGYIRGYVESSAGAAIATGNAVPLYYIAW